MQPKKKSSIFFINDWEKFIPQIPVRFLIKLIKGHSMSKNQIKFKIWQIETRQSWQRPSASVSNIWTRHKNITYWRSLAHWLSDFRCRIDFCSDQSDCNSFYRYSNLLVRLSNDIVLDMGSGAYFLLHPNRRPSINWSLLV